MYPKADSTTKHSHLHAHENVTRLLARTFKCKYSKIIGLPLDPTCRVGNNGRVMHFCLELQSNEADRCLEA